MHAPPTAGARPRAALASWLLAAPALIALAWEPARWLARTWRAPAYDSDGHWIALATIALVVASVRSGAPRPTERTGERRALGLFVAAAALRLAGRVLSVHTIGAFALVLDVAAVAWLCATDRRPFAVHPGLVAAFFALSLPLEHHAQRVVGYPLQLLSAALAEAALSPAFPELERAGVQLRSPLAAVAVELPCSGARGLLLYTAFGLGTWSRCHLGARGIAGLGVAIVGGALVANTLRIAVLFAGQRSGLPVSEEPWHGAIGCAALVVGALPLIAFLTRAPGRRPEGEDIDLPDAARSPAPGPDGPGRWASAVAATAIAVLIANAPAHPIDVAPSDEAVELPTALANYVSTSIPLSALEQRYFTAWGGGAAKRRYVELQPGGRAHTALWVRTRSPLRHLHGPDVCLTGAGHRVEARGVRVGNRALPTAVYRSVAPDGRAWRIEASYVSDRGAHATSASQVLWAWVADPGARWSLLQRISPWSQCETTARACERFDRALLASLDLAPPQPIGAGSTEVTRLAERNR